MTLVPNVNEINSWISEQRYMVLLKIDWELVEFDRPALRPKAVTASVHVHTHVGPVQIGTRG